MKKEYDSFLLKEPVPGQETEMVVRDLTPGRRKYEAITVRAIIASSPEQIPDSDILWLRSDRGTLRPQPWAIRVLEVLGGREG